ncbi:MAG: hypothetical protein RIT81_25690 [Deltaproteobacteria bacterium]
MIRLNGTRWVLLAVALAACNGSSDDGARDGGPTVRDAGDFCPERLRFSVLDDGLVHVGWTGATHNNAFPVGSEFVVDVTGCDPQCRNCRFEGPVRDPEVNLQRCMTDSSISCQDSAECPPFQCITTTSGERCANNFAPCASDADCMPGECSVYLGSNSGSPIRENCFAVVFRTLDGSPPVQGTTDLDTGRVTFDNFGIWIVASDLGLNPGFCPVCVGDDVPRDGQKNGTCSMSPHGATAMDTVGQPCDLQTNSGIPSRAGEYSLDCAVPFGPSFDMSSRGLSTSASAQWTLDDTAQPMCNGQPCWCGVCEGTPTPCHDAGDCSGQACVADVMSPAVPPQNNFCVPGSECVWDNANLRGTCMGVVGVDMQGNPIIAQTSCLPQGPSASVSVQGASRPLGERSFSVNAVGLSCAGQSFVGAVNQAIGLPGPNVSVFKMRMDLE